MGGLLYSITPAGMRIRTIGFIFVGTALASDALAQATRSTKAPAERNLLDWYLAGGVFMHPIALCSVIALAIVIERLIALRRAATAPAGFLQSLWMTMRDIRADRETGLAFCRAHDHALARIVAAGIRRFPLGFQAMEKAMEDQGASEAVRLRRNMRV